MGFQLYKRLAGIISLLALAGLLASCSAAKIFYNQAPDLAYWYFDGYVDFNEAQSLQIKGDLNRLQAWHRKTQLAGYVEILQKLQQQKPSDLDAAQTCMIWTDARRRLMLVTDQAEPAIATLVSTLSASQLEKLEQKFAKGNASYRKDYIESKPESSRNKRYKQAVSRAEKLYGGLDEKQLNFIDQRVEQSSFNARLSYAERLRRQTDMLQTLRTLMAGQTSPEKIRSGMHTLIARTFDSPNPAYRQYIEKLTQESCHTVTDLHNSTTPAQRKEAVKTLISYEQDLGVLIGQNLAAQPRLPRVAGP